MMSAMITLIGIMIVSFLISPLVGGEQVSPGAPGIGKAMSADQVEIVYSSQGRGETAVIFIHGGFANRSFWVNQMKPLSKHYQVIAVDLGGHGDSGKNRKNWGIVPFAEDVRAVMEKEKIRRAVVVGNSMGGSVALETARLLPEKVIGIVAVDTLQDFTIKPPQEHFRKLAQSFRTDFTGTIKAMVRALFHTDADPAVYAEVEKKMLDNTAEMAGKMIESFAAYDHADTPGKIPHPIRCINGDLYPTDVQKNRTIHADFEAVILPHTGHYPMLECPELFNRHLEEILKNLEKHHKGKSAG